MPKKLSTFLLSIILALSFILRVYGINYGLPLHLHPDEWSQIEPSLKMFNWDLNPHIFYYPSFLIYFLFAVFKTLNALIPDVFKITASKEIFYLTGRLISVIFGTLNVLLVYFLAKKLFNEKVALTSSFLFAISPLHVRSSHYAIVDIPLAFFICGAIYFCISVIEEDSFKNLFLAGLMGGVASSTKYTAFPLLLIIYSAFLVKQYFMIEEKINDYRKVRNGFCLVLVIGIFFLGISFFIGSSQAVKSLEILFSYKGKIEKGDLGYYFIEKMRFSFFGTGIIFLIISLMMRFSRPFRKLNYIDYFNKKIIYTIFIFLITFLIISPYILLDFNSFFRDFKFVLKVSSIGFYENRILVPAESPPSFISHLKGLISEGGLIFFIFFILGIITYIDKRNLIPFLWAAIYFLTICSWKLSVSRYLLPIIPLMVIYTSAFIFFIIEKLCLLIRENKNTKKMFSKRGEKLIALLSITLCSIIPFENSIATVKSFKEGSTLVESFQWIERNIKERSKMALIGDAPDLTLSDNNYSIMRLSDIKDDIGNGYIKKNNIDFLIIGVYKYNESKVMQGLKSKSFFKLVKEIRPDEYQKGPVIKIYEAERNRNEP